MRRYGGLADSVASRGMPPLQRQTIFTTTRGSCWYIHAELSLHSGPASYACTLNLVNNLHLQQGHLRPAC